MSIRKVRFINLALVILLAVGWLQPTMAYGCSSAAMGNGVASPADLSGSGVDEARVFMETTRDHPATAFHNGSSHDASSHMPAGKPCAMKACFQAPTLLIAQHFEFFILPTKAEFIALQGDICIPSSHLGGLFRPPRLDTIHWG